MIIKASQRSGARNLANHLMNEQTNDHVDLHEVRGLVGQSLHAALLEIDGVSQGTRCQQPLFSVSFNPPEGEDVSYDQFASAFDRLEKKLGLTDQPRAVVFHEKEGRRHAHVVWSRIDSVEMKAINMSHFKSKCTDISRQLYIEHGWEMPRGLIDKKERDPFQLTNVEWQQLKRQGIDPKEIKVFCQDAWKHSDNLQSFKHALEERNMFLAQGDRRGFVVMDHSSKVYSLSRFGGINSKDLKTRLGSPDQLPTVRATQDKIRSMVNSDVLSRIKLLKKRHSMEIQPLQEKKAELVRVQRAERRELSDQQNIEQNIVAENGKGRFRRGVMGFFDKVTGKERRLRLINQKETAQLKQKQKEAREAMIFRQNRDRTELQKEFKQVRGKQQQERILLAKRIHEFRQVQAREQVRKQSIRPAFDRGKQEKNHDTKQRGDMNAPQEQEKNQKKKRGRTRNRLFD